MPEVGKMKLNRRELFAVFLAAPFLAVAGNPKPRTKLRGKFIAEFKYCVRPDFLKNAMLPIIFKRQARDPWE